MVFLFLLGDIACRREPVFHMQAMTVMEQLAGAMAWFSGAVFSLACLTMCASALWLAVKTARAPYNSRAHSFVRVRDAMRGEWADLHSARLLRKMIGVLL